MSVDLKRLIISLSLTTIFLLPQTYKVVHDLKLSLSQEFECPYKGDHVHAPVDQHNCDLCEYQLKTFDQNCTLGFKTSLAQIPSQQVTYNEPAYYLFHFSFQLRGPPVI